jgi:hypothetical protein
MGRKKSKEGTVTDRRASSKDEKLMIGDSETDYEGMIRG